MKNASSHGIAFHVTVGSKSKTSIQADKSSITPIYRAFIISPGRSGKSGCFTAFQMRLGWTVMGMVLMMRVTTALMWPTLHKRTPTKMELVTGS